MSSVEIDSKALWTLIPIAATYGVVSVLIFRRFANQKSIRRTMNLVLAHGMELGLFFDSPTLVFRAQRDLLRENAHLLRLVIVPAAILALLFALIFGPMNVFYGLAPLPIGEPSVVTIQLKDRAMPSVQLEGSAGLVIETPGVRVLHARQISWRVRPIRQTYGDLRFRFKDHVLAAGMYRFFLRDPDVRFIDIRYPKSTILGLRWLTWFVIISSVSALTFGLCWKR